VTLRLLVLIALIGAAVALTGWLKDLQEELQRVPPPPPPGTPDYAFHRILLTAMGVDGEPLYRIRAPRMTHFPASESSLIISPRVWFFRDEGPPVQLRAQRAKVFAAGERIWLPGEVDIVRPPYRKQARMTVETRDVTVFPKSRKARTQARVQAASGPQRLEGVGMLLDLAAGTLDLQSRVRGTYVP
jgi:lipopolysaccharide export system protein LptC